MLRARRNEDEHHNQPYAYTKKLESRDLLKNIEEGKTADTISNLVNLYGW